MIIMAPSAVMDPTERLIGIVAVTITGCVAAYVILRNTIAKRRWVARSIVRFVLGFTTSLLTMWLIAVMGFRGWWVQYVGYAIGMAIGYRLVAPLSVQEWMQQRGRRIPETIRKRVIERHKRLNGSYDPTREHIDHVYPFSKGGGHTLDNLHIIPREQNQRKRDQEPRAIDWAKADLARALSFIQKFKQPRS